MKRRAAFGALLVLTAIARPGIAAAYPLTNSGGSASAYTVDSTAGTLAFGDGLYGQSVPDGSAFASAYGGGADGNVPSDIWACLIFTC